MKTISSSALFLVLSITLNAQSLDSIGVFPVYPNNLENIVLSYTGGFVQGNCDLNNYSFAYSDSVFIVYAYYSYYGPSVMCVIDDQIEIGNVSSSTRKIVVELVDWVSWDTISRDTLDLVVSGTNSISMAQFYPIPTIPSDTNKTQIVVVTDFPKGECNLNSNQIDVNSNEIIVDLSYTNDVDTFPCTAFDTISLGVLDSGHFNIKLNVLLNDSLVTTDTSSINVISAAKDTNIIDTTDGTKIDLRSKHIRIIPNPIEFPSLKLKIVSDGIKFPLKIKLFDVNGRLLIESKLNNSDLDLSSSGLSTGIYVVKILDLKNNLFVTKLIVK